MTGVGEQGTAGESDSRAERSEEREGKKARKRQCAPLYLPLRLPRIGGFRLLPPEGSASRSAAPKRESSPPPPLLAPEPPPKPLDVDESAGAPKAADCAGGPNPPPKPTPAAAVEEDWPNGEGAAKGVVGAGAVKELEVDEPNGDGVEPNAPEGADDENVDEPKAGAVEVAGAGAPKAGVVDDIDEVPPKLGSDDVPKGVEALAVPPKAGEGAADGGWAKDEEEAVEDVRAPPNCVPKPDCMADDAGGAPNAGAAEGPPKALADVEAGAAPKAGAEAPN